MLTPLRTLLFHSTWLGPLVRVMLGGLFVAAGAVKLADLRAFAHIISAYDLLPEELLVPAAVGLPSIEFLAGLGLMFNVRGSLAIICALLTGFLFAMGYAIWKNLDVDCGCFSPLELHARNSLHTAFLRDLGLIAASVYLMIWKRIRNRLCVEEFHNKKTMEGVDMVRREKLIALILGCIMAFSVSGTASALEWGSKEIETEKLAVQFANQVMKGGYKIVTTEELKAWMDKKDPMLIVDTMPLEDSYKKNHIPGAVQIEFPVEEMSQLDEAKKGDLEKILGQDKNRKIIFYCGFTKCGRSHNAAMWAAKLGYTYVYRQPGGIKAWMEADYPVEKQNN